MVINECVECQPISHRLPASVLIYGFTSENRKLGQVSFSCVNTLSSDTEQGELQM